jgi:hypothetical protein
VRDLYIEATYYRVPELQAALTDKHRLAILFRIFGTNDSGNPFDSSNRMINKMRTFLLKTF